MKVEVIHRSEEEVENCDYCSAMEIRIDGERVFGVMDGEPEDATLGRDFNDVYSIPKMLQLAYDAGKRGEPFELTTLSSDEI